MSGFAARPVGDVPKKPKIAIKAEKLPPFYTWTKSPTEFSTIIKNKYMMESVSRYESFLAWLAQRQGVVASKIRSKTDMRGFEVTPTSKPIEAVYLRRPGMDDQPHQEMIAGALRSIVMVNAWDIKGRGWSGSGAIIDPTVVFPGEKFPPGTYAIITNDHVVPQNETKYITVTLADQRVISNVRVLQSRASSNTVQDSLVDSAVIIVQSVIPLPTIPLAKENPKIGDTVFAFGHPYGLPKASVTRGIVSQHNADTGAPIFVIQHDAEINPGNSGGPLLNERGELLGLNTFTFKGSNGLSFAMPIQEQLQVLNAIYKEGEYVRGYFGFSVDSFSQFERMTTGFPPGLPGAKVTWVDYGTSAEKAGLKPNDIITRIVAFNGSELDINIDNPFEVTRFLDWMHKTKPGMPIHINVMRPRKEGSSIIYFPMTMTVTASRLEPVRTAIKSDDWGILIQKDKDGRAIITAVDAGSPAAIAGIAPKQLVLDGIEAREISEGPVRVGDLEMLKNIFIMLRESGAESVTLYVSDVNNSRMQKKIVLTRKVLTSFLLDNRFGFGIASYLAT